MPIPIQYAKTLAIVLGVIWLMLFPFVSRGTKVGQLFGPGPAARRLRRASALLAFLALPACCAIAPRYLVWVVYGSFPLGQRQDGIAPGMTAAQVRATLGPPHEVLRTDGADGWIYWRDSFGDDYVVVYFDSDSRVRATSGP
jgi:hypothetical protein